MTAATKTFRLATGEAVAVREPALEADLGPLVRFLSELPESERNCLRYDVTSAETCRARLSQLDGESHFRLVAELGGTIVGDATLDREPFAWTRHVAQIRCVLAPGQHEVEVGAILFRELVSLAEEAGIERLFAEVMEEQRRLIGTLEKTGFVLEATLRGFARDLRGANHDLLVYTNELGRIWERLAMLVEGMDIRIPS